MKPPDDVADLGIAQGLRQQSLDFIKTPVIKSRMLQTLQIRNFALIENATIEFGEGLNILSGETGAGKSIIVQALELLLGGRGSSELIRTGEEEAEVTGLFSQGGKETTLRRLISSNGKNRAYLNERPVPVSVLEETGGEAVDLAGQHAHQVLLLPSRHLSLLDEFGGVAGHVESYQQSLEAYRCLLKQREDLMARETSAREKEEFLRFHQKELAEAKIQEGEEERLQQEREVVKNAVRLGEICLRGEESLESGEDAVAGRISRIAKEVHQVSAIDPILAGIEKQIEEAACLLQEAAKGLRHYGGGLSFDPDRLQEIEDRLALISRLKRKYGGSLEALLQREREIADGLSLLDHSGEEIGRLDGELSTRGTEVVKLARLLSQERKSFARSLSRDVQKGIRELGMSVAKFSVRLEALTEGIVKIGVDFLNEQGGDKAEFLLAPNPGEGDRPLSRIASGGEVSRVFLAIKRALGAARGASTTVFDEVDAGIGGGIAEVVGKNLAQLAKKRQVICITHLPQIACYANHHFVIEKRVDKGRTQTDIQRLGEGEREQEIARMLAGIEITDKAVAHAREMLKNAANFFIESGFGTLDDLRTDLGSGSSPRQ